MTSQLPTTYTHIIPSAFNPNPTFKRITNFTSFPFSTSDANDNNNKPPASDDKDPEDQEKTKIKVGVTTKKKEKAKAAYQASLAENSEDKKLKSVPIRPIKLPLKEGEEELKVETFVLFSSNTPIIPYTQQSGLIRTGNLGANHISNKLAFFIQNELGEIYTVGLVLEDNVNKSLKKNFSQGTGPDTKTAIAPSLDEKNKHKANITTKGRDYKIKLIEIEFKDSCIFAKGIPYRDSKPTEAEKKIDISQVLTETMELAKTIRELVAEEKIEVFTSIPEIPDEKKMDHQRLDEILCYALGECYKLATFTKEGLQPFVEAFLEERSIHARMFMIKKKLEEIRNILEVVNRSVQYNDDQIWKPQENAKARLSFEYIRSNYFSSEGGAGQAKTGGAGAQGGQPNYTGPAKKFVEKLHLIKDEVSREKIAKEIERFALQDKTSEYHKLYTYLDDVFSIPWETYSDEVWDVDYSQRVLEKQLFGLEKVKERITEMIAVNKLKRVGTDDGPGSEKRKGFVILLNGPPGTGKTTIAKAIATALKRESRFISFAGVTDPAFVKGHKRTYLDAQPGVFVKELVKSKVMNPVFILDEVDKLSKHHQGVDPYYALMEILNPEENHNFTDHYLDIKVDFSNVIFILTANQILNMLEPLRNRLEIIEVPAYIEQEKLLIGKEYLLPAVLTEHGLEPNNVVFDDDALTRIIKGWCYYESGVREFRRCLERIARKHALEILDDYSVKFPKTTHTQSTEEPIEVTSETVEEPAIKPQPVLQTTTDEAHIEGQNIEFNVKPLKNDVRTPEGKDPAEKKEKLHVTTESEFLNQEEAKQLIEFRNQKRLVFAGEKDEHDELLKKYLGLPVFDDQYERKNKKLHKGTVNVLTVSGFVGHVLSVECVYDITNPEKKGQFSCSGNLQKVLQESLTIARLVALRYLPADKIKEMSEKSVHIHFLQGGTPKDGPSAGISICSALISLVLDKPIDAFTSMTGELSLNGEVYKIGGVQAKVTASKALGIKRILLPWGNKTDFLELPQLLKDDLEVYFVKEYKEVYDVLFGESPKELERIEKFVNGKYVAATPAIAESSTVNA